MLRKSTYAAKLADFRAVAGTSTMIPTLKPGGSPRPANLIASSSSSRTCRTSSTVLIIGNIRLIGTSCATRTAASNWSARSCGRANDSRMPRTPRNGLASAGIGR